MLCNKAIYSITFYDICGHRKERCNIKILLKPFTLMGHKHNWRLQPKYIASNTICGSAICEQQTKLIWFRVSQVAVLKIILWPPSNDWWLTPVQIMKSPMTSRQWAEKVIWCILSCIPKMPSVPLLLGWNCFLNKYKVSFCVLHSLYDISVGNESVMKEK